MNITIPLLKGAADAAAIPGDSVTSLLKMMGDSAGLFADNSPDGWLGMLMSGLSGVATALAVAIMLTVYFRSGHRRRAEAEAGAHTLCHHRYQAAERTAVCGPCHDGLHAFRQ